LSYFYINSSLEQEYVTACYSHASLLFYNECFPFEHNKKKFCTISHCCYSMAVCDR